MFDLCWLKMICIRFQKWMWTKLLIINIAVDTSPTRGWLLVVTLRSLPSSPQTTVPRVRRSHWGRLPQKCVADASSVNWELVLLIMFFVQQYGSWLEIYMSILLFINLVVDHPVNIMCLYYFPILEERIWRDCKQDRWAQDGYTWLCWSFIKPVNDTYSQLSWFKLVIDRLRYYFTHISTTVGENSGNEESKCTCIEINTSSCLCPFNFSLLYSQTKVKGLKQRSITKNVGSLNFAGAHTEAPVSQAALWRTAKWTQWGL